MTATRAAALLGALLATFLVAPRAQAQFTPTEATLVPWCSTPEDQLLAKIYDKQGALLPVIPERVIVELEACHPKGSKGPAAQAKSKIEATNYRRDSLSPDDIKDPKYQSSLLFEECVKGLACEAWAFVMPEVELNPPKTAKTGGLPFAWILGHTGDEGHYEVTMRAMETVQPQLGVAWKTPLLELVAKASGDADFYHWNTPAAHAQTSNAKDTGQISQTQPQALESYRQWVSRYAKASLSRCQERDSSGAAYLLGYFLHAVQDLAFHEGITNAEHSYLDSDYGREPVDSSDGAFYARKMSLASMGSARVLAGYFKFVRANWPDCWAAMVSGDVRAPSIFQKIELLGGKAPDFTPWALIEFRMLASDVHRSITSRTDERFFIRSRWLDNGQEARMIEKADEIVSTNFTR